MYCICITICKVGTRHGQMGRLPCMQCLCIQTGGTLFVQKPKKIQGNKVLYLIPSRDNRMCSAQLSLIYCSILDCFSEIIRQKAFYYPFTNYCNPLKSCTTCPNHMHCMGLQRDGSLAPHSLAWIMFSRISTCQTRQTIQHCNFCCTCVLPLYDCLGTLFGLEV